MRKVQINIDAVMRVPNIAGATPGVFGERSVVRMV